MNELLIIVIIIIVIIIIILIIIIIIIIIIMQRFYILGFQSLHLPIKKIDKYLQIHVMETKSKEE